MTLGALGAAAPQAHAASMPKPMLVKAAKNYISVKWAKFPKAKQYRVAYSTSSSMKNAKTKVVKSRTVKLKSLKNYTAYYIKVRPLDKKGRALAKYSKKLKVRTLNKYGFPIATPSSLKAKSVKGTSLKLTWKKSKGAAQYQVLRSTSPDMTATISTLATSNSVVVGGLTPSTTYYFKVRAITASGKAASPYSARYKAKTPYQALDPNSELKVASFNVKCSTCRTNADDPEEGTWYQRRDAVVSLIRGQMPDVLGVQEASQGRLRALDGAGDYIDVSQFEDLVQRLGYPYALTNTARYNCDIPTRQPAKCTNPVDQGASRGTKIIYNTATLTLESQGSKQLPELDPEKNDRYVSWAIFTQNSSGKRFFFADVHLEYTQDKNGGTEWYELRRAQTQVVLAEVAAHNQGLPTFIVGDFNSSKWKWPTNGPYDLVTAAGYVDPLGNYYGSTTLTKGATVEHRIRTNCNSFNDFNRHVNCHTTWVNGTYLDYIFTSPGVRVPEWETVFNLDSGGNIIGQIPSDHTMIRATTVLP
ncbi:MAG: fibronectin type III domain-containing protein [Propionibacteriaceae bacterium]|nr:fibronectin type III domain-containing protein [Propionibacteriaceae bacterium]